MMRSAIVGALRAPLPRSAASPSTSATMRAPWIGGLTSTSPRTMILSCDRTRSASSRVSHTIERTPTRSPYSPKFFANDCARRSEWPSSTKRRIARRRPRRRPTRSPGRRSPRARGARRRRGAPRDGPHCSARRVDAGRVVRARVQQEDRAVERRLDVRREAVDVEAVRLAVEVAVALHLQPGVAHDRDVVAPRRVGQVDLGRRAARQEARVELAGDAARAGARERLHAAAIRPSLSAAQSLP